MHQEEIFNDVLSAVHEVTGLPRQDIVHSRTEMATDARTLLVRYLIRMLPPATIAGFLHRTRQGVSAIAQRTRGDTFLMQRNWKEICKQLESKYSIGK